MLNFSYNRYKTFNHQPSRNTLAKYIRRSLKSKYLTISLSVEIVSLDTSFEINHEYRNIKKPTNVISLEYPELRNNQSFLSGELIFCDEVIVREASEQNKTVEAHYAHMVVHGMLHLQGYDHQNEHDAAIMESLETSILQSLGFNDPYLGYHIND